MPARDSRTYHSPRFSAFGFRDEWLADAASSERVQLVTQLSEEHMNIVQYAMVRG